MTDRDRGFTQLRQGTLYQAWAKANPGEVLNLTRWFAQGPVPTANTMTGKALCLFAQALDGFGLLRQGTLYRTWARANAGEAKALDLYLSGTGWQPPIMNTATGKGLAWLARMLRPQHALWQRDMVFSANLSAFTGQLRLAARQAGFSLLVPNLLHDPSAASSAAELTKLRGELDAAGWQIAGWGVYGYDADPVQDARDAAALVQQHRLAGWIANGEDWCEHQDGYWKTQAFIDEWDRVTGGTVPLAFSCLSSSAPTWIREFDYTAILDEPGISVMPQVYGNVDRGITVANSLELMARTGVPRQRLNLTFGTYDPPGPIPWADYLTWPGPRGLYLGERITAADIHDLDRTPSP